MKQILSQFFSNKGEKIADSHGTIKKIFEFISLLLLSLTGVVLIGMQQKIGLYFLGLGTLSLFWCRRGFRNDIVLIYISVFILSFSHINTDISYYHMFEMWWALTIALALPYVISKYVYQNNSIEFSFWDTSVWSKKAMAYLFFVAVIAYFLIPFYLKNTGAYLNWSVESGVSNMVRLFIGTNALGIWDELFFISTVLGLIRKWIPFFWANILQAILFTSFLYELWFTGWWFVMIFAFALIQWAIFKKTQSLSYIIAIHLTVDLILFLALIYAHEPKWMPIFL